MKKYEDYPDLIRSQIDKAGSIEAWKASLKERAAKRKDYSTSYFAKLKAEGKEDEIRALQKKGAQTRKKND